ncbi:LysM peptidoglycan-binding domain-containing protein [Sessilibacter corallicola]|uniref:LysM peptidoglycan-binding domain-containing protein n=1 Tax=Sessilibacter corallicola TaxID=2904075 RepID=UPI001E50EB40|nr:LysM peptidoglycan-binding domain-containing protein [Sessilibacter corallicola]
MYKYKVKQGDTLWGLANEYSKISTNHTNRQAQAEIQKLNPRLTTLKIGAIINLPFKKDSDDIRSKTPYEKWKDTINGSSTISEWHEYDPIIKVIVSEFNSRLGKKSKNIELTLPSLDWKWIKAIIWVESGGPTNSSWKTRPMQIGNPGDKGLGVLQRQEEASNIIMDNDLRKNLHLINTPQVNIKAGTAYLLNRLALSEFKSVKSQTDRLEYTYTVTPGDNLDKIAKKVGTTVEELKISNPSKISRIHPNDVLKYHKASVERVIVGWRPVSANTIAQRYNVGDPNYSRKLTYIINEIFSKKY